MRKPIVPTSLLLCMALAACDLAPPPPKDAAEVDAKPDADTSAVAREGEKHHELQEGIDSIDYRDKAAAAGDAVEAADRKREQDLKDAGG